MDNGYEDIFLYRKLHILCNQWYWRVCPHTTSIGTLLAIVNCFVVLCRCERNDLLPVCNCKNRDFFSRKKLFNDDLISRISEDFFFHNIIYVFIGIFQRLTYKHTFTLSQPIGLNNQRKITRCNVFFSLFQIIKGFKVSRGNAVFSHKGLCKHLASLDDRCPFARTKYMQMPIPEPIDD